MPEKNPLRIGRAKVRPIYLIAAMLTGGMIVFVGAFLDRPERYLVIGLGWLIGFSIVYFDMRRSRVSAHKDGSESRKAE